MCVRDSLVTLWDFFWGGKGGKYAYFVLRAKKKGKKKKHHIPHSLNSKRGLSFGGFFFFTK